MDTAGVIWTVVSIFIIFSLSYIFIHSAKEETFLRENGIPAIAHIISARQTGSWAANNPEAELELEIHRQDGEPVYVTKTRETIPVINASSVEAGKTLHLLIAPDDPNKILIDEPWNR